MKIIVSGIFPLFFSMLLLTACEKPTAPYSHSADTASKDAAGATVSKDVASLVVIKAAAADAEDEHAHHGEEGKSAHRQLGAHVHGAAAMNLVLEQSQLSISMNIPGMDAVGFEHPAVSAEEQATLQKALTQLQNPDALFVLSKNAECQLNNGTVETGLLNKEAKPGAHANVDISYQWQCKFPEQLKNVAVNLFGQFEHLQKIRASWVSPNKQSEIELSKESAVITLE